MWKIERNDDGAFYHFIVDKPRYTVGRSNTDLVLLADTSISRSHAALDLDSSEAAHERTTAIELITSLNIQDLGSKYGTHYYDKATRQFKKLPVKQRQTLAHGDLVRFGALRNVWHVQYIPIKTMATGLSSKESQHLMEQLQALGGTFLKSWHASCTHMTTQPVVSVTMKVLYALVEQKPFVTCNYWTALLKAARLGLEPLPRREEYMPQYCEVMMKKQHNINLKPKAERKRLFAGWTFVFVSLKHQEILGPLVELAGAATRNLNNGVQKTFLIRNKVIVLADDASTQTEGTETLNMIAEYLEANKKRLIQDYEIGLAILHCSVAKYCNPHYKAAGGEIMPTVSLTMDLEEERLVMENTDEKFPERCTESQMVDWELLAEEDRTESEKHSLSVTEPDENSKRKRFLENDKGDIDVFGEDSDLEVPPQAKRKNRGHHIDEAESDDADDLFKFIDTPETRATVESTAAKPVVSMMDSNEMEDLVVPETENNNENGPKETLKRSMALDEDDIDNMFDIKQKKPRLIQGKAQGGTAPSPVTRRSLRSHTSTEEVATAKKTKASPRGISPAASDEAVSPRTPTRVTRNLRSTSSLQEDESPCTSKAARDRMARKKSVEKQPETRPHRNSSRASGNVSTLSQVAEQEEDGARFPDRFLGKKHGTQQLTQAAKTQTKEATTIRGPALKVISVADAEKENDDDLFNFIETAGDKPWKKAGVVVKPSNMKHREQEEDDDEGLFAFTNSRPPPPQAGHDSVDKALSNKPAKINDGFEKDLTLALPALPQPKPLPAKVSIRGWLTKLRIKEETINANEEAENHHNDYTIKDEQMKGEGDGDGSPSASFKWANSLKDAIIVRPKLITLVDRKIDDPMANTTANGVGRVNFKKFVKQSYAKPEKKIRLD